MTCRHRKIWLICGGWAAWCYQCGAWRQLKHIPGQNASAPDGPWYKPTGPNGPNPASLPSYRPRVPEPESER